MKGSRWFIICILLFLLIMFAVEYHLPKKFVWTPTFGHYDEQPLGCALFDSLLSASLPRGYSISNKTFYQLEQEDSIRKRGILIVDKNLGLSKLDVNILLNMAARGSKIMLVATSFSQAIEDTLKFDCTYSYFNLLGLKQHASSMLGKDTICWVGDSSAYRKRFFECYPSFCGAYLKTRESHPVRILAEKTDSERRKFWNKAEQDSIKRQYLESESSEESLPVIRKDSIQTIVWDYSVAFARTWGKGEIILVSTPLLFTNYGVVDGDNATYLFRLLSQMGELPIVRITAYNSSKEVQRSPFRYFLSKPPLRWALYLTMITIVLFMCFSARRRQRAIPVIRDPENKSLEFTELIGTLYYQEKNQIDLVKKKYTYFAEELRRSIQVDVEDTTNNERLFRRIAQKTGMDAEEIKNFFQDVRPVITNYWSITDAEMKKYIDKMNEIINHI